MIKKFTKKQMLIIESYKKLLDNPFADGYTWKAFEGKYNIKTKAASKLYERYLAQARMNLTKEQAFDMIEEEVRKYNEAVQFGYCRSFPADEIQAIIRGVND